MLRWYSLKIQPAHAAKCLIFNTMFDFKHLQCMHENVMHKCLKHIFMPYMKIPFTGYARRNQNN